MLRTATQLLRQSLSSISKQKVPSFPRWMAQSPVQPPLAEKTAQQTAEKMTENPNKIKHDMYHFHVPLFPAFTI